MTITSYDPIAVWHFNSKNFNQYYKYSNRDFGCYPIWVFWNLKKVLEILYTNRILLVNELTFLGEEELVVEINDVINIDGIIDIIVKKVNTQNVSPSMKFSGQTILVENGEEKNYLDIINFHCCLNVGNFTVTSFSDCWVPIDRDDKLQIDLAEHSSPILYKTLKEIKGLGFDSIYPNYGVEYTDELLPQLGFKVYLYDSAINEINFNELSVDEKKSIEKYLWKNRNDPSCEKNSN